MICIIVILLIVVSNSVLSHADKVNESEYLVKRVTDCFFIDDSIEAVELVCDNISGNHPKDNCYSTLFKGATQQINRSKVKRLRSGQCRSNTFDYSQFEGIIYTFPNITALDLSLLRTDIMVYYSKKFPHLTVLNMSHNRIGFKINLLSIVFTPGTLDLVDVSFNNLKTASFSDIQLVGNITSLNMSYNSISYIAARLLTNVQNLRVLDLSYNKIELLAVNVLENVHDTLEEIQLQNNKFKHILDSWVFLPLEIMVCMNFSGRQIEDFNKISGITSGLPCLDISRNNIQEISMDHRWGEKMKSLNVNYNRLRTFNYTHNESMVLQDLKLEGNDLYQLDTITPSNFPNLTTISISKNRFDCEYAKKFVQQWKGVKVIGDVCDQKGNEPSPPPQPPVQLIIIVLLGCSTIIASIWIVRHKLLTKKKQEIVGQKNVIQCRSSDEYEEPLPHVEPIYHEIDYSETLPPNSSHANKQYDHLTRNPMPLSPIQLHYDNVSKRNVKP